MAGRRLPACHDSGFAFLVSRNSDERRSAVKEFNCMLMALGDLALVVSQVSEAAAW